MERLPGIQGQEAKETLATETRLRRRVTRPHATLPSKYVMANKTSSRETEEGGGGLRLGTGGKRHAGRHTDPQIIK